MAIKGIVGGNPGDLEHATEEGGQRPGQPPAAPARRSDEADVSALAAALHKLEELKESDPDRFRQVLSRVAGALRGEALGAADPRAALLLHLAERFEHSAADGSLPVLSPAGVSPVARSAAVQRYGARPGSPGGAAVLEAIDLARLIHQALG